MMKKLKYSLIICCAILIAFSCGSSGSNNTVSDKVDAESHNFSVYKGKIIDNIRYCDSCDSSGDNLIIEFTDGTELRIYAYKYNMKVYK